MKEPSEQVQKLQKELVYKENILLAKYSGLLGFSAACLLSVMSAGLSGYYVTASFCAFVISTFSYATIVLGRVFILHKGLSVHIGHVIVAEDASGPAYIIGGISLIAGLSIFSAQFSFWCAPFVLVCAGLAFQHHIKFMRAFNSMMDARDIPTAGAQQTIPPDLPVAASRRQDRG